MEMELFGSKRTKRQVRPWLLVQLASMTPSLYDRGLLNAITRSSLGLIDLVLVLAHSSVGQAKVHFSLDSIWRNSRLQGHLFAC